MFNYPFSGIAVENRDSQWVIGELDKRGNAWKLGLETGDVILNIDGEKVEDFPSVIRWGTVDKANYVQVYKNNESFKVYLRSSYTISPHDVIYLVGEAICFVVAFILYKWMNRSQSARFLAMVFFNMAITFLSLGASVRGEPFGKLIIAMSVILIPAILLHFLIAFMEEKGKIQLPRKALKYLYIFILICLVSHLLMLFEFKYSSIIHGYLSSIVLLLFSIGVCLDLSYLFYAYAKYKKMNPYISTMIRYLGVSFAISATPIVIFSFIPKVLYGHEWIDSLYTSIIILFFPLSLTYLLAAKKIYDIDLVVRRFILTTFLSIVPALIVVAMISSLFTTRARTEHLILAFIFTIILFSITLYSLEYLTTKLERVIYPRRHFLQASLKKIAKKLGQISSIRDLKEIILADIVDIMQVSGGAFVLKHNDYLEILSEGEVDGDEIEKTFAIENRDDPSYTCFEITRNEDYVSYLVLGPKKSNTLFGSEETQWLNLITTYLSVSMENLYLIRKMNRKLEQLAAQIPNESAASEFAWFRKLMFELQERERSRIATDLHDTTMQDLFFLKRKLAALNERYPYDPDHLKGIYDYIDVINTNLRQSCFELHPYLLQEVGLVRTVEKIVEMEKGIAPFDIEFQASGREEIEACDPDTKRHLFRVFQELLNNAKKHSNASRVRFRLRAARSELILSYEDDGVGFDADRPVEREIGGSHMGMEQMRSRILSMDGEIELASGKGKGMRFKAILPLKEGRTA